MARHSNHRQHITEQSRANPSYNTVDYAWFATRFETLLERFVALENTVAVIEQAVSNSETSAQPSTEREYYSVMEFASLVERNEYTVRECCRLERINAEKCECGRGDAKSWKIPVEELQRYHDHGLLPTTYVR